MDCLHCILFTVLTMNCILWTLLTATTHLTLPGGQTCGVLACFNTVFGTVLMVYLHLLFILCVLHTHGEEFFLQSASEGHGSLPLFPGLGRSLGWHGWLVGLWGLSPTTLPPVPLG